MCKRFNVFSVKIRGWLVQGKDAAVQAEGLGQGQADDEGGQHLERASKLSLCADLAGSLPAGKSQGR